MRNQEEIQATYNVEDPIDILFGQIETGQEFYVAGNSQFSYWQIQTWMLRKFWRYRNIHMHIACGRVLWQIIAHGCGSSLIFRNPNWRDKSSSRRPEWQAMEVPTI